MSDDQKKRAAESVSAFVPHLRLAAKDAKARAGDTARVQFAIIARKPDGSGEIGASFDCDDFLDDMATLFPVSKDGEIDAEALCFIQKNGLL